MVRKGFLVLLAALLVPALAAAYTMVLKDGRKIEAQSRYLVESGQVKFTGADGRAYQFPLGQVDLAATNPPPGPPGGSSGKRKLWGVGGEGGWAAGAAPARRRAPGARPRPPKAKP